MDFWWPQKCPLHPEDCDAPNKILAMMLHNRGVKGHNTYISWALLGLNDDIVWPESVRWLRSHPASEDCAETTCRLSNDLINSVILLICILKVHWVPFCQFYVFWSGLSCEPSTLDFPVFRAFAGSLLGVRFDIVHLFGKLTRLM